MKETHYEVLGLRMDCSAAEIRAAYRKLALRYHPDQSSSPASTEKFLRIGEAYQCLIDPSRRAAYDRLIRMDSGKAAPPPKARPTPPPSAPRAATKVQRERIEDPTDVSRLRTTMQTGRFAEAEAIALRLKARDPLHPLPYAALGDIARARGDYQEAAKWYAYAAQMDPRNEAFQRRYEEVVRAAGRRSNGEPHTRRKILPGPLVAGLLAWAAIAAYLMLSREEAILPGIGWISTWTLGLVVMLLLGGVTVGASLSLAGLLDRYEAVRGSAVSRVAPAVALAWLSAINFWVAAALYVFVGITQDSFHPATSRLVAGVALVTGSLAVAGATQGISSLQVLIWGGNLCYVGALLGWITADGLSDEPW
jgi:curved DNA-binding protein CbpA